MFPELVAAAVPLIIAVDIFRTSYLESRLFSLIVGG